MMQFAVSCSLNNRNFEEIVNARSAADAINIVKAKYSGILIYGARRVG